jgi:hypothetical protein
VSRFKFHRSDGLSLIKPPLSAGLHKALINIKRLRRQAVTAIYIIVKFSKAVYGSWSGTLTVKAKKSIFKRVSVNADARFSVYLSLIYKVTRNQEFFYKSSAILFQLWYNYKE